MAYYVPSYNYRDTTTKPPSVTNHLQDIPWECRGIDKIKTEHSLEGTAHTLYTHAIRDNPKVMPHTSVTMAYGDLTFDKMNNMLQSDLLVHRRKALSSLVDILRRPQYIVIACKAGLVDTLTNCRQDHDAIVREEAMRCLGYIAVAHYGKEQVSRHSIMVALTSVFDDPAELVRKGLYNTLLLVCDEDFGISAIYDTDCVPRLVQKVSGETGKIQPLILRLIRKCFRLRNAGQDTMDIGAMAVFGKLLTSDVAEVREEAARCIQTLSIDRDGKELAISHGCVPPLVQLCSDESEPIRTAATGALMNITLLNDGKWAAISNRAIEALVSRLTDSSLIVIVNAVQCINNLAEDPDGREKMQSALGPLRMIQTVDNTLLRHAVHRAIAQITWKP